MGNDFDEGNENKDKETIENNGDDYIKYGIVSQKGGERHLEDTFISFTDLESSKDLENQIHFGLFGVFDGHNNVYVANYLKDNCQNFFQKEAGNINKDNYKQKIEEIFKAIDKEIKSYGKKEEGEKNDINNKNINFGVKEEEIKYFKDLIQNTKEIPEDLKKVEDSQIKDLLLFRNLFKYNNNYLYSDNDVDYIGSSASIVLITNDNIITADLGITACILIDKDGKILNGKETEDKKDTKDTKDKKENKDNKIQIEKKEILKPKHVFENKSEKKRIKRFNESIDYENLKYNIYVPASRCFGLFKYKADDILKEENQIISCVPEVNIYNRDSVDYILLMTKGMINLFKDDIEEFAINIANIFKESKTNDIKDILKKEIDDKIKELEKNPKKEEKKEEDKGINIKPNSFYVGKEDFEEENEIINELKKNYYKDIMDLNKNNCYSCHDKYNITCILMKVSKEKYPTIKVEKKTPEEKKEINKDKENKKVEEKKEEQENNNKNEIILEEKKEEIKNEIQENKEVNNENKIEEEKVVEKKDEEKNEEDKNNIEDIKLNIDEENKNNEEKKELGENEKNE